MKTPKTPAPETATPETVTPEIPVLAISTEQVIESARDALKKHALAEQLAEAVAELSQVAKDPIKIGDQDAIKAVDTARKKAKAIRTSIERKRKELKAVALEYGNAVDTTAKELSTPIEVQERRLEAAIADVARREKQEKERAEREALERFNARTAQLFAIGVAFSGNAYELGNLKAAPARIENATDEEWPNIVAKFQAEADRLSDEARAREEEAAKAKALEEENARLRAQLAEMLANQKPPAPEPPTVLEVDAHGDVVDAVALPVEPADVDSKGRYVAPIFKPLPIVEGEKVVTAAQVSLPIVPVAPTAEPELSPSEANLQSLLNGSAAQGTTHYSAGYRKGVAFVKAQVLSIMADTATYDTRGKVKAAIEAI